MINEQRAGLCSSCEFMKLIESERGSKFVMCLKSKEDPGFRKYPPLPVLQCSGYQERREEPADSDKG